MEDILDYDPDAAYRNLTPLHPDREGRLSRIMAGGIRLAGLSFITLILGGRYADILWKVFNQGLSPAWGFALLTMYLFGRVVLDILLKFLWECFGSEYIGISTSGIVLRRTLFFSIQKNIPLRDIQGAHWQYHGYSCHEWHARFWNVVPFHFGRVILHLKNGKKLYFGSRLPLREFIKLDERINISYGRDLVKSKRKTNKLFTQK